jgi:hypothetical protein
VVVVFLGVELCASLDRACITEARWTGRPHRACGAQHGFGRGDRHPPITVGASRRFVGLAELDREQRMVEIARTAAAIRHDERSQDARPLRPPVMSAKVATADLDRSAEGEGLVRLEHSREHTCSLRLVPDSADSPAPSPSSRVRAPSAAKRPSTGSGAVGVGIIGILGMSALTWLMFTRVSPYIDTAFQIRISRTPSMGMFLNHVVADNQAPGAQLVFWFAAHTGLQSIDQQRLVSLIASTIAYAAAVWVGCRWRSSRIVGRLGSTLADNRALTVATVAVVLAGGVFSISTFVRYSSLVGSVWLLAFLLSVRAVNGEADLTFLVGLSLAVSGLIAYSVVIPILSAGLLFVTSANTRHARILARFAVGVALGLVPVAAWLVYAGHSHLHRVFTRVDVASGPLSIRSVLGKAYEVVAWLVVGPASLPSALGLAILISMGVVSAVLVWVAITRGGMPVLGLLAFVIAPVPLLFATQTATGWSMTGPAAIAAFVAGLGAAQLRLRTAAEFGYLACVIAVSALTLIDVVVLRPTSYASDAEAAVDMGGRLAVSPSSLVVAGDWTIELLLADGYRDVKSVSMFEFRRAAASEHPDRVILVFGDPGQSSASQWEQDVRAGLQRTGYILAASPIRVGTYESYSVRQYLGLVSQPSQYEVEVWSAP